LGIHSFWCVSHESQANICNKDLDGIHTRSRHDELDHMSADKAIAWRNLQRAECAIGNGFDAEETAFLTHRQPHRHTRRRYKGLNVDAAVGTQRWFQFSNYLCFK
jgi:hypothetical protein